MTIAGMIVLASGCFGLLIIGYCAGWADCERKLFAAKPETDTDQEHVP